MKYRVTDRSEFGEQQVKLYSTEAPNEEATFAFQLLERWGLISAVEDGEDSVGRMKSRILSPLETVRRAFEISYCAFEEARRRGLMLEIPDLNEVNKKKEKETA